ncbi:macrolide ABC transporter ATP-binding protein [Acrocarpospora phusangensis]|uniref:Macrolide ABC transporter ATP-binding protein n=1 Tax=Acrocarpospora phusangensis TaxID=1070424 RepID=A0A919QFC5_9ACTN|nr:ABC transporter ATP-binding protein [Acrocarpospora phusangensis]GIH27821.1 macrolide ABC transporter ATP-binding protein [Acrocarpospora phusangensis]
MNVSNAAVRVRGLVKDHGRGQGRVRAVDEVDLEVPQGQMLAVMGPSGCGKSTLLHLLGGLERPTDGEVWVAGRRIDMLSERALARMRRRSVGFVFQAFHLVEELSAAENVELPALLAGRSRRQARRRASLLLERVGLAARARHLPSQLSGGQRQRVAVARALVNDPLVVLADEPTGNLDTAATLDVLKIFEELRSPGQSFVIVTHDERVAATADRLVSMRDGMFVDDTWLAGSHPRGLGGLIGLEG